jgi:hypothetical protein
VYDPPMTFTILSGRWVGNIGCPAKYRRRKVVTLISNSVAESFFVCTSVFSVSFLSSSGVSLSERRLIGVQCLVEDVFLSSSGVSFPERRLIGVQCLVEDVFLSSSGVSFFGETFNWRTVSGRRRLPQ